MLLHLIVSVLRDMSECVQTPWRSTCISSIQSDASQTHILNIIPDKLAKCPVAKKSWNNTFTSGERHAALTNLIYWQRWRNLLHASHSS